jgi:hypothetical protein
MAENKVPLEEGNPGSAMSIREANGLDPMKVSYATKLFSFKFKEALQKQMLVVKDDNLRDSMRHTTKIVEVGAKLDTATDHRGWIIPVRTSMLTDVQDFCRRDVLTGEGIDTANPGSHINTIPKGTVENTNMTCFGILQLYEICKARGGKAATHVNTRATCSNVCEQLFSTTQNLTKEQFSCTLCKQAIILRNLQDPDNLFYMPIYSITKNARHSHGDFNDPSARHDVRIQRPIKDNTTTIGCVNLRFRANVKARKE